KTEKEMKTIVFWKHDLVLWTTICLSATALLVSTGCSNATSSAKPPDPTEVEVVAVEQKDVPIYAEWIGTLSGQVNADIKAQVTAAKAAIGAAKAQIQASQAAVETATINLNFTRIVSPIDGIAGIAQAQVGNLVSTSSGALTTISTLDPIRDYFSVSEQEYL